MLEAIIAYRAASRRARAAYDEVQVQSGRLSDAREALEAATTDHQVAVRALEKTQRDLIAALDKSE